MRTTLITILMTAAAFVPAHSGSVQAASAHCASAYCVTLPSPDERLALMTYLIDRKADAPVVCDHLSGADRTGCTVVQGVVADRKRAAIYATFAKDWDARTRKAFAHLLVAEEVFARAVGDNETDHVSADSGSDAVMAQQAEKSAFVNTLKTLVDGTPRLSFVEFAETDSALNAAYAQVMAVSDTSNLAWGSVEKAGIKSTQRAWLAYRDAFVAFAATLDTDSAAAVKAELTTRRTVSLEGFLED